MPKCAARTERPQPDIICCPNAWYKTQCSDGAVLQIAFDGNMRMNFYSKSIVFFVTLSPVLCASANAGSPEVEAGRCTRWLDAFINRNIEQAAMISVEHYKADEVPNIYIDGQRKDLNVLYDNLEKIGASKPKLSKMLEDHIVKDTNDIIRMQIWDFEKGSAYVGCVSYPGTDDPWHLVVKFDDNADNLTKILEDAALSHVLSPPAR